MADKLRKKLNIKRTMSVEPMSACELQTAEAILAKLVARAYATEHPEFFGTKLGWEEGGGGDMTDGA